MNVLGTLIEILDNGEVNLSVQREISWILLNVCCLPDDQVIHLENSFQIMRTLSLTIQRCNTFQEQVTEEQMQEDPEIYQCMNYIDKIRENSLWAIGNVTIASMAFKSKMLDQFRICILIRDSLLVSKNVTIDYLNIVIWCLSLLIRDGLQ